MCRHRMMDRKCPLCHAHCGNLLGFDEIIDKDLFYSLCPRCNDGDIMIDESKCNKVIICGEPYVFLIHKLACLKCKIKLWTRVRGAYYCHNCDYIWDVSSKTISSDEAKKCLEECGCAQETKVDGLIPSKG